jgi:chromosome partitioning protein
MNKTRVIAFAASKGGVGKSTSTQNVGTILSLIGYKVLCVDMDNQGHLSSGCKITPESLSITLTNLIDMSTKQEKIDKKLVESTIIKTSTFDLLPCTFQMDRLEYALNSISDREYVLTDILDHVRKDYDIIILDCNSRRDIFTINALSYATDVIIPCQSQYYAAEGIDLMLNIVQSLKRRINPNLQIAGILMTMYQSITKQSRSTVEYVRQEYNGIVYNTIIPMSTTVPDAQKLGMSVYEYDKTNPVSIAYQKFVEELIA